VRAPNALQMDWLPVRVDTRSISSPKRVNIYYFYSYYQVFCTDINSFTPAINHLTMLYHVAVVVRIHDILMVFTMTNFCTFKLVP